MQMAGGSLRSRDPTFISKAPTWSARTAPPRLQPSTRPAGRIAVARGAAYALHLARELRHAKLVEVATPAEAFALFGAGEADAMAGVRQALTKFAQGGSARVLADSFQIVEHALITPTWPA